MGGGEDDAMVKHALGGLWGPAAWRGRPRPRMPAKGTSSKTAKWEWRSPVPSRVWSAASSASNNWGTSGARASLGGRLCAPPRAPGRNWWRAHRDARNHLQRLVQARSPGTTPTQQLAKVSEIARPIRAAAPISGGRLSTIAPSSTCDAHGRRRPNARTRARSASKPFPERRAAFMATPLRQLMPAASVPPAQLDTASPAKYS